MNEMMVLWKLITCHQYYEKQVSVSDFCSIKKEVVPFDEKYLKQDSTYEYMTSKCKATAWYFFMRQRNKSKPV